MIVSGRTASRPGARSATSTPTPATSSRPSTNASASSCPRGQGLHPDPARGRELPVQLRRRRRADAEGDPVLHDARHAGDLAQGLEGRRGAPRRPSDWGHFAEDRWELYDTEEDRTEMHDLAGQHPEKLQELIDLWFHEAGRYYGLPLDDRTAVEILTTPAAADRPPRDRYIYYPGLLGGARGGRGEHPRPLVTRSPPRSTSTRRRRRRALRPRRKFGGHALYVKDGKLKYVYNFCGLAEQTVESRPRRPHRQGRCSPRVRARGRRHADARGTLTLYIDDEEVGERRSGPSPASSRSSARASTSAATAASP